MVSTLVTTFFYPAYATEDLIESWSGTTESSSLKKIFTCSRSALTCWIVPSSAPVKLFAAAVLTAAALGSSCGEEACGLFGELFRKLEVRAVPGIRVEDQPGIR